MTNSFIEVNEFNKANNITFSMEEQILSQPSYLSVIWLILALNIWIANIFTAFILWRSKISREKSEIGRTLHSLWNLICTDVAFSLVGLNLFVNMTMILARDRPLSSGWCDFFGFLHTFSFNFAAFGILVGIIDRSYNLLKPFKYNIYLKGESRVPAIIFVCSALYGAFLAIVPLTRLGNYYQSEYATCLISYGEKVATRLTVVFNFSLFLAILTFITLYFRQMLKVYAKRRQMNVSVTRRKETLIFGLVISSLFLTCWCPYMVSTEQNLPMVTYVKYLCCRLLDSHI